MRAVDWDVLRLFLHIIAATVWVGGQITLGALVPTLRRFGPDVTKAAARGFARVAWPAFLVLLVTGMWNIAATPDDENTAAFKHTLVLKLVFVVISGASAYAHQRATSRRAVAVSGAVAGLSALAAVFVGVQLVG